MCGAFGTFAHQAYTACLRGQLSSNVRPHIAIPLAPHPSSCCLRSKRRRALHLHRRSRNPRSKALQPAKPKTGRVVRSLGASRGRDSRIATECALLRLPSRWRSLPHLQGNLEGEARAAQSSPQFTPSSTANTEHGQRKRRIDRIHACDRERWRNVSFTSRTQCIFIRGYHLLRLECGLTPRSS